MSAAENPAAPQSPDTPKDGSPADAAVAVVNLISGPSRLARWIRRQFGLALATLEGVAGLREFRLVRVHGTGGAVFASIAVWDAIADFQAWRASPAFRRAHPDAWRHRKRFAQLRSEQQHYPVAPHTRGAALDADVMHRVSAQYPELVPADGQVVHQVHWPRTTHRAHPQRAAWILVIACTATFLGFLDTAVVNMTYSAVARSFPAEGAVLTWVVSGYAVAFAALLTAAGRWSDVFGHRRILLCGVGGFAAASLVCACAPTAPVLIGARIVQGAAAALLLPAALGALLASVPPRRAPRVIGAWAATGALAAAIGPAVGAAFVDLWGWRAVFAINIPICLGLLLGGLVLPAGTRKRRQYPDLLGVIALCAGIAALVAALTEGHQWGWGSPITLGLAVGGLVGCGVAYRRGRTHARPALPVSLWRSKPFALSTVVNGCLGFAMGSVLLAVPLFLQQAWHLSLLHAAGCIGAIGVMAMLSAAVCGRTASARQPGWLCVVGMMLVAVVCAMCASQIFTTTRDLVFWALLSILLGIGVGATVTGLAVITAATVPAGSISSGLGMGLTGRQTGAALGVAMVAAVLITGPDYLASVHTLFAITTAVVLGGVLASVAIGLTHPSPGEGDTDSDHADLGTRPPENLLPISSEQ